MKSISRIHVLAIAVFIAIIAAAFSSGAAFAQNEDPPPAVETTGEVNQEANQTGGENDGPNELAAQTQLLIEEVPPPPPPAEAPGAPVDPDAPAGPAAIVTGDGDDPAMRETGEQAVEVKPLDLYQSSGGIDPSFNCTDDTVDGIPDGTCQYFGSSGLEDAINDFTARGGSGLINVEAATYSNNGITINGIPKLTGIVGAGSSVVTWNFGGGTGLDVTNTTAGFILKGMKVAGNSAGDYLVAFDTNAGNLLLDDLIIQNNNGTGSALLVNNHTGNVTVTNVIANQNGENGANIETVGSVTIKNSSFDRNNGSYALQVYASKSVLLDGVTAFYNFGGDGALLTALSGITVRNSFFYQNTDSNPSNTKGNGLVIQPASAGNILIENVLSKSNEENNISITTANGSVTLKHVEVSNANYGYGIYIDNCILAGGCTSVSKAVALTNIISNLNEMENIYILSNGNISLTDIQAIASDNGSTVLHNQDALGTRTVTVMRGDFGSGSEGTGLEVRSKGSVTLDSIISRNNVSGGHGLDVDNSSGSGSVTLKAKYFDNQIFGNLGYGVKIISKGSVSISDIVDNSGNTLANIYVNNTSGSSGKVTIKNAYASSSSTGAYGVEVLTNGVITLDQVISNYNFVGGGASLNNSGAAGSPGVTVTNIEFIYNKADGLNILTKGSVKVDGVDAYGNNTGSADGIDINNTSGSGSVSVSNVYVDNNTRHGLVVASNGAIIVRTISANGNGDTGILLDNFTAVKSPGITLEYAEADSNSFRNIHLNSKGAIKTTDLSADFSNGSTEAVWIDTLGSVTMKASKTGINTFRQYGAFTDTAVRIIAGSSITIDNFNITNAGTYGLDANNTSGKGNITISNTYIYNSESHNLMAFSNGSITLNGVLFEDSVNGSGAVLNNLSGNAPVIVKGLYDDHLNQFYNNDMNGLQIFTNGKVSLTNISAESNGDSGSGRGIDIPSFTAQDVTLSEIIASYNEEDGIYIEALGAFKLTNVVGDGQAASGIGIHLDNTVSASAKAVTLTGVRSQYNKNGNLRVVSNGSITIRDITAVNSLSGFGAYLDNTTGTSSGVKILASKNFTNEFYNNEDTGLQVYSNGVIVVNSASFDNNDNKGAVISNTSGTGSVTLKDIVANSNDNSGIEVSTNGAFTATNLSMDTNGLTDLDGFGLLVEADGGNGKVTLTGLAFYYNYEDNLRVLAKNLVTLKDIASDSSNIGYGIHIDNSSGTGGVTLTSSKGFENFSGSNELTNFNINTKGKVSLKSLVVEYADTGAGLMILNTGITDISIDGFTSNSSNLNALDIASQGAVTLNNIYLSNMGANGIVVDNFGSGKPVKVTKTEVSGANAIGIHLKTDGNVTLTDVISSNNNSYGAQIDYVVSATPTLTVTRGTFNANTDTGLNVIGGGNVTLNTVIATGNYTAGSYGVRIQNDTGIGNVTVTGSSVRNNFSSNAEAGLQIVTNGSVTISKADARNNSKIGIDIDADGGAGKVTLTDVLVQENSYEGAAIEANNTVTLNKLNVIRNGLSGSGSGITVNSNNADINLSYSNVRGNASYGIQATAGTGTLTVKKTSYFGNHFWVNPVGLPNINMVSGTLVIIP